MRLRTVERMLCLAEGMQVQQALPQVELELAACCLAPLLHAASSVSLLKLSVLQV